MRLIYAVTYTVLTDLALFARRLATWGAAQGYTTHWLETPAGETPADYASRPLIIYKGEFENPELGVTLLAPHPSMRVSYFVSPDATPAAAHKLADDTGREITKACGAVKAATWDLYSKPGAEGPYRHLESGTFGLPPPSVAQMPAKKVETWN